MLPSISALRAIFFVVLGISSAIFSASVWFYSSQTVTQTMVRSWGG